MRDLTSAYQNEMIKGVDDALAEAGLDLMLCTTNGRERREASYVRRLSVGLVDGLIVLMPHNSATYSNDLASRRFPFVLLDDRGSANANSVIAANATGARQAVDHLVALGHRRVAHIAGPLDSDAGRERLAGFNRAVAEHGLDADPDLVRAADSEPRLAHEVTTQLLDGPDRPTAIFVGNDEMALAVIKAAHRRGLSVPRDLSVVGFDNVGEAERASPGLTTVGQPLVEMGRRAVGLLRECIEDPARPVAHIELPTTLVVRGSTAPPPIAG
ncbi:MAG: substrate-binding domain-containing protein [Acidimicrobiales bacterium]